MVYRGGHLALMWQGRVNNHHVVIPQFNRDHVRTMMQQSHQAGLTGQFAELVCPHCNNVSLLVLISQGNIITHVFTRLQAIIF